MNFPPDVQRKLREEMAEAEKRLRDFEANIVVMKKAGIPSGAQEQQLAALKVQLQRLKDNYGT